jgi:23S rRNA pseudouridine2604 synthase
MDNNLTRLNKFISESGICSRREADEFIAQGRVTINGKKAELGSKVSPKDLVKLNGKVISGKVSGEPLVYIAFNKPVGVVCTTEKREKNNIIDYLKYPTRIFPIGRLDKLSEGLIFLTNDGDIVNKVLRATNNHEKEYIVSVNKALTDDFLQKMRSGVPILNTITLPCKVEKMGRYEFRITLTQGLNRQIRRMCEHLGYEVSELKRVRIMNVNLKNLETGKWRKFTDKEVNELQALLASSTKLPEKYEEDNEEEEEVKPKNAPKSKVIIIERENKPPLKIEKPIVEKVEKPAAINKRKAEQAAKRWAAENPEAAAKLEAEKLAKKELAKAQKLAKPKNKAAVEEIEVVEDAFYEALTPKKMGTRRGIPKSRRVDVPIYKEEFVPKVENEGENMPIYKKEEEKPKKKVFTPKTNTKKYAEPSSKEEKKQAVKKTEWKDIPTFDDFDAAPSPKKKNVTAKTNTKKDAIPTFDRPKSKKGGANFDAFQRKNNAAGKKTGFSFKKPKR